MTKIAAVIGTDDGRVAEEALKLFEVMKPEGSEDFGNDIIEGQADNVDHATNLIAETLQAVQTLPFFGGKIVWLKGANFLGDDRTGGSERTKESVEKLMNVLKAGLDPNISFLLSATAIDKRRAFYKYLKKDVELKVYDKIDVSKDGWEEQVASLVVKKAKPMRLTFDDEALDLFVQQAGEDTRQITNELEKLGLLRAAIIPTMRNTFYAKLAMTEAGVQRADSRSFNSIIKRINSTTLNALPKKADGKVSTWALGNCTFAANKNSLEKLKSNVEACLKADRALVTTAADHHMVLHRLIIELTS